MNFIDLPLDIKGLIFNFFTYDEISRLRQVLLKIQRNLNFSETNRSKQVSKEFNLIGQQRLNSGFKQVTKRHTALVHRIKSILPRRESERRNHALSRHNEILTAVETRISLLNMTIMKHVSSNQCCFMAGKVSNNFYVLSD